MVPQTKVGNDRLVLLLAFVVTALSIATGCSPTTHADCVADASTRPTDAGVRLAQRQCDAIRDSDLADERTRKGDLKAATWARVAGTQGALAAVVQGLGPPDVELPSSHCASDGIDKMCVRYGWEDARPQKMCASLMPMRAPAFGPRHMTCFFQLEVLAADPEKTVYLWWPESF